MMPSGSVDAEPSSITLSFGKAMVVFLPALGMGGLLPFLQSSQENSFLQEFRMKQVSKIEKRNVKIGFMTKQSNVNQNHKYIILKKCEWKA